MRTKRSRGRPPHGDQLTPAEWNVADAVRHGLSNPAIARAQGVSTNAVKFHMANILQTLGLARRAKLGCGAGCRATVRCLKGDRA